MFDVVQIADGRRHSIMKGDKVLAPTELDGDLYEPGTVIDGQEGRETSKGILRSYTSCYSTTCEIFCRVYSNKIKKVVLILFYVTCDNFPSLLLKYNLSVIA